jgi:hypothetical protein
VKAREMSDQLYDRFQEKHGGILHKDLYTGNMMECAKYLDSVISITMEIISADQSV